MNQFIAKYDVPHVKDTDMLFAKGMSFILLRTKPPFLYVGIILMEYATPRNIKTK
ncbi:MAG: hypothetical protein ABSF80_07300 [Chitinispirillaceae bacterium]